jgi:hypothetical protein
MKQLTKEQQEHAVELIELGLKPETLYDKMMYIQSAKAFLQSLKPKIYVCSIDKENYICYLGDKCIFYDEIESALIFDNIEDARKLMERTFIIPNKDDNIKLFILME